MQKATKHHAFNPQTTTPWRFVQQEESRTAGTSNEDFRDAPFSPCQTSFPTVDTFNTSRFISWLGQTGGMTLTLAPFRALAASGGGIRTGVRRALWNSNAGRLLSTSHPASYLCVHVFCTTKPGTEEEFRQASLKNARQSAMEEGIARFDVLQDKEDVTKFVLVEVYKNADAPGKHKETTHYLEWRDTVADMMAEPRQARKFDNLFPTTTVGWDYPEDTSQLE